MNIMRCLGAGVLTGWLGLLAVSADTVLLKSGTSLGGKVTGYDGSNVTVQTLDGITAQIPVANVVSIAFGNATAPSASAAAVATPVAAAPAVAAPAATPTTLPAGTALLVSLDSTVDSKQSTGAMFQATFLQNVTVGGQTAVPAGAKAVGKLVESRQGGRIFGRASTEMVLTSIIINGQSYAVQTNSATQAAKNGALGKTATNAAAGAAIGAALGDAGTGAAIGASATLLRRSEGVSTPAGTVLQFVTAAPTTL